MGSFSNSKLLEKGDPFKFTGSNLVCKSAGSLEIPSIASCVIKIPVINNTNSTENEQKTN